MNPYYSGDVVLHVNPETFADGIRNRQSVPDLVERVTTMNTALGGVFLSAFNPGFVFEPYLMIGGQVVSLLDVREQYPSITFKYDARQQYLELVVPESQPVHAIVMSFNKPAQQSDVEIYSFANNPGLRVSKVNDLSYLPTLSSEPIVYSDSTYTETIAGPDNASILVFREWDGFDLTGTTRLNLWNWPTYQQPPLNTLFSYNDNRVYGNLLKPEEAIPLPRISNPNPFGFGVTTTLSGTTLTTVVNYRKDGEVHTQTSSHTITGFDTVYVDDRFIPCIWDENSKTLSKWVRIRVISGGTQWLSFIQNKFVFDGDSVVDTWSEIAQYHTNTYISPAHYVPLVDSITFRHSNHTNRGFVFVMADGSMRMKTVVLNAYEASNWDITFGLPSPRSPNGPRPMVYMSRNAYGQLARYEYSSDEDVLYQNDNVWPLPVQLEETGTRNRRGHIEISFDQTKLLIQVMNSDPVYGFNELVGWGLNSQRMALLVTLDHTGPSVEIESVEYVPHINGPQKPVSLMADNTLVLIDSTWLTDLAVTVYDSLSQTRMIDKPSNVGYGMNADTCPFLLGNLYP